MSAASELIRTKGVEGIRVRQIADLAGMSAGSVLYHFPQTEDLILRVHAVAVDEYLAERGRAVAGHATASRSLLAALAVGLPGDGANDRTIELMVEMHSIAQRSPAHQELLRQLFDRELELQMNIIAAGASSGELQPQRPLAEAATVLLVLENGLALHLTSDKALTLADAFGLYVHEADRVLGTTSVSSAANDLGLL